MIELKIEIEARESYARRVDARIDTDGEMSRKEAEDVLDACRRIMANLETMLGHVKDFDKPKEENNG